MTSNHNLDAHLSNVNVQKMIMKSWNYMLLMKSWHFKVLLSIIVLVLEKSSDFVLRP